jgi:hypothetical protein
VRGKDGAGQGRAGQGAAGGARAGLHPDNSVSKKCRSPAESSNGTKGSFWHMSSRPLPNITAV